MNLIPDYEGFVANLKKGPAKARIDDGEDLVAVVEGIRAYAATAGIDEVTIRHVSDGFLVVRATSTPLPREF